MSFRFVIMIIGLFSLAACGVKSRPYLPPETAIDSYIKSYTEPAEETKPLSPPAPPVKK